MRGGCSRGIVALCSLRSNDCSYSPTSDTPVGASAALVADPAEYVLGAATGGILLLAYVAALVTAGTFLVTRRDVT